MQIRALQFLIIALACCLAIFQGLALAQAPSKDLQKRVLRDLAQLETRQKAAKTSFLKSKKNDKLKRAYLDLTGKLAYGTMTSLALSSKEKYPKALRLYREVLGVEPNNADAKKWKDQIEAIYRSMGRPIPKG